MKIFYFSPPACLKHDPNPGHPECPDRLSAIKNILQENSLFSLVAMPNEMADENDLLMAHSQKHIDHVFENIPTGRSLNFLDDETVLCSDSKEAALYAVGAVLQSIDAVLKNDHTNAFCAVRPPGHHAHRNQAAGFCLFNNVAIGAIAALERHGLHRVAILDFDVHHGDGTQDIVRENPNIFFASTYQYPIYQSGYFDQFDTGINNNILNIPIPPRTKGDKIVELWKSVILPKVESFRPQMIFVSAGFDGHRDDPLADLEFIEEDYAELMSAITNLANRICAGKLVTVLEGGYNLEALANSVFASLKVMGK
jgi:acetoin utilization deacetylase AcuC-like enzyme